MAAYSVFLFSVKSPLTATQICQLMLNYSTPRLQTLFPSGKETKRCLGKITGRSDLRAQ